MLKDHEILRLLNSGEQRGMEALFARYYKPLVLFAEAYVHNINQAEDLVQEQFVKLWTKKSFREVLPSALSSFLFTVVRNACINDLEKRRIPLKSLELPHLQIAQREAEAMDDSVIQVVSDALVRLPEKTRLVVECVMLKDRMYKEAAEELGVSVNTIKTLLKQGIKELRVLLRDKQELIYLLYFYSSCNKKLE